VVKPDWVSISMIAGITVAIFTLAICAYFSGVDRRAHALECAKLRGYWDLEVCHAVKP
jgi:hypothetical protein